MNCADVLISISEFCSLDLLYKLAQISKTAADTLIIVLTRRAFKATHEVAHILMVSYDDYKYTARVKKHLRAAAIFKAEILRNNDMSLTTSALLTKLQFINVSMTYGTETLINIQSNNVISSIFIIEIDRFYSVEVTTIFYRLYQKRISCRIDYDKLYINCNGIDHILNTNGGNKHLIAFRSDIKIDKVIVDGNEPTSFIE